MVDFMDDIVISGMSGRFPDCDTVLQFQQKLFAGEDLVKDDDSRWPKGYMGSQSRMGKIKDLRNLDAPFFGIHPKLAHRLDPMVRLLLETSFEAIMDAGICPTSLRGSETAVIVAVSTNEAADWWSCIPERMSGYDFLGVARTFYSNRISYALDLRGPSYTMDCQSCSGLAGIQQAYQMLINGTADAVIVAGANLVLNPIFNKVFENLGMLSHNGKCKTFDADANGNVRSEACVSVILQRKRDAKRAYGSVMGVGCSCIGYRRDGCDSVDVDKHIQLYEEIYGKFGLNAGDVSFVEAHGFATVEGDEAEARSLAHFFCKERKEPLLIGSVKSNVGHTEPVGGLVSLVKVLLAMENGIIAPNLHLLKCNPNIQALQDGTLKVVDKLEAWEGNVAAINSFGIGGSNSHLVLKSNEREKGNTPDTEIPRLIIVSGRTRESVASMLNKIEPLAVDNEFCSLIYNVFEENIPNYNFRSFAVFGENAIREIQPTPLTLPRKVCFVFSGMGSQWPGMCKELWPVKTFRNTLKKCAETLKSVEVDLFNILFGDDTMIFENPLNSFVGITSIQVALVEVLNDLCIKPDYMIGHSIGELGCAYADGTLTLEETVLTTYLRGKAILEAKVPKGSMAAIGLSFKEISKRLPSTITVACQNSANSVTISGLTNDIKKFVRMLQKDGIFAREVNSSNIAFHSPHIVKAGVLFEAHLKKIITNAKLRSQRWISSSVPKGEWDNPSCRYSSPQYHVNNLVSPVLFEDSLRCIPDNVVVIEVSPHALLQSILKGAMGSKCVHVPLVKRSEPGLFHFLANIGRLYMSGLQPSIGNLYPPVTYPVSRKTPMIQSIIEWDHSVKWFLLSFLTKSVSSHGEYEMEIDITDEKYKFLKDFALEDELFLPISAFVYLIWEAAAHFKVKPMDTVLVKIENLQILASVPLTRKETTKLQVIVLENGEDCEVKANNVVVAKCKVNIAVVIDNNECNAIPLLSHIGLEEYMPLKGADVYKILWDKGHRYGSEFRCIKFANNEGNAAHLEWNGNWTSFLECFIQIRMLRTDNEYHYVIDYVQKIVIDPRKQGSEIEKRNSRIGIPVYFFENSDSIKSSGVEFHGIKTKIILQKEKIPEISSYEFQPYCSDQVILEGRAFSVCLQLVAENISENKLNVLEVSIRDEDKPTVTAEDIFKIISREPPHIKIESATMKHDFSKNILANCVSDLIISKHQTIDATWLKNVTTSIAKGAFILVITNGSIPTEEIFKDMGTTVISRLVTDKFHYLLLRKTPVWTTPTDLKVSTNDSDFAWIKGVRMALKKHELDKRTLLLSYQGQGPSGILGFVKCIRRKPHGTALRCLMTDDSIDKYSMVNLKFANEFRKGLVFNVYKEGKWGSYRKIVPLPVENKIECEHAYVGTTRTGDLSSLSYIESRMPFVDMKNYPNHEMCHVYYSGIYASDLKKAMGSLIEEDYSSVNQGSVLGEEFSGRNSNGKRVFGVGASGSLATSILVRKSLLWSVPDGWTLMEASTAARPYALAYYTLVVRGGLKKGERVYVNSGIYSLSVVCAKVALSMGARLFIGHNDENDWKLLVQLLKLPRENLINLSIGNLDYQLLERTNNEGVDLIFDTLNTGKRNIFVNALAEGGRLLEFDKITTREDPLTREWCGNKNVSFMKICRSSFWWREEWEEARKTVHHLVLEGIESGVVAPLCTNVFKDDQLEQAFKFFIEGKHLKKVTIQVRQEEKGKCVLPIKRVVKAQAKLFLNPKEAYVVTAGFSDEGVKLINWLARKGAKNVLIASKYNPVTGYQSYAQRMWKSKGMNFVIITNVDATTESGAECLIQEGMKLGSIAGVFHLAKVGCETHLEECGQVHFHLPWKAIVETAKNLDEVTRQLCPTLKYFVGFSRIESSLVNIAYASSAMEQIYEKRRSAGFPSTVIQCDKNEFDTVLDAFPLLLHQTVTSTLAITSRSSIKMEGWRHVMITDLCDALGITDVDEFFDVELQSIGLDSKMTDKIKGILEHHGFKLGNKGDIGSLTFSKIATAKMEITTSTSAI